MQLGQTQCPGLPPSDAGGRGRSLIHWSAAVFAIGMTLFMRFQPEWVERHYALGWYRHVRRVQTACAALFPISLAELLAALVLAWLALTMIRVALGTRGWRRISTPMIRLLQAALWGYLLYLLAWGGNQYRVPLEQRLLQNSGGPVPSATVLQDALPDFMRRTARNLAHDWQRCEELAEGGDGAPGGFRVWSPDGLADERMVQALHSIAVELPEFAGERPVLRAFAGPGLWHRLGIAGLYVPFTGEPHFLGIGPPSRWPFHALHEAAHQRGYAREDEANFLAWWMSLRSQDPFVRYSAHAVAWAYGAGELQRVDLALAGELTASLPSGVLKDFAARRRFWDRGQSPLRRVGRVSNDVFLKAQGQTHGVRTYARMLRLMLQYEALAR